MGRTKDNSSSFYRYVYPDEVSCDEILRRHKEGQSKTFIAETIVSIEKVKKKDALSRVETALLMECKLNKKTAL